MHSGVTSVAIRHICRDVRRFVNIRHRSNESGQRLAFACIHTCGPVRIDRSRRNENLPITGFSCQRRNFSAGKLSNKHAVDKSFSSAKRGETRNHPSQRSYQAKSKHLFNQIKTGRIQPELVTQKVEELLLLSLSEYNNRIPSDGPLALDLLNTALRYAKQPSKKESSCERLMPRIFSLVIQLMLRSGHTHAPDEVHRQLLRLLNGHEKFLSANDSLYNTHHVNEACNLFIRHVVMTANKQKRMIDHRRAYQLNRLIQRLRKIQNDPSVPLEANPYVDDSLILLLCNQLKLREAREVLQRRIEKSLSASPPFIEREIPLVSSFITIINGYAKTLQPDKALGIINLMMSFQKPENSLQPSDITAIPPPNIHCFNGLLHAYAMAGGKDAGFKAEQTIEWMQQIYEIQNLDTRPNATSYNICINAWDRSHHPEAPIRAETLLRHVVAPGESGSQIEPSEEAFVSVMNTWVNSSYNKDTTKRVTRILDLMEHISEKSPSLTLSAVPYAVLIKAWGKATQESHGIEKHKCGDEILRVLKRMRTKNIIATTGINNSVITALGEISPNGAIFYFLELEQQYCDGTVELDTRTFNCALNAIAVLNRPDAVKKATEILKRMFEYCEKDPSVIPSTLTFNIILKVLSRSTSHTLDAATRADELLSEMSSLPSVTPDFISYVTCIIAWGRSNDEDKIQRVTDLMHRFIASIGEKQDKNKKANIAVFNAVLSVCSRQLLSEPSVEALRAAELMMTELRKLKGISPDQKTYESFFQALKNGNDMVASDSTALTALLENEFDQCANDGYVTKDILLHVSSVMSEKEFKRLVGQDEDPKTFSIPHQWRRNTISA